MSYSLDHNTRFAPRSAPFGTVRKVPATEAARWPEYQRRPIQTAARRDWTHDQIDMLVTLLDKGLDYTAIARRLGRTRTAIQVKVKRLGCAMTKRPTVLVAREVAAVLGLRCAKKVVDWIGRGWLRGKARGTNGRPIWAVQWDDLMAFLQNRMYWMAWRAEDITDRDLRAEMIALRAHQPRWLTPGEVAHRYCVDDRAVNAWVRKGYVPAQRYGNWWIWEADLQGWVLPCERSRVGIPRVRRRVIGAAGLEPA